MGTRCGDVDPSIMPYLCKKLDKTPDEILDIYNKKSGMLGISGISSDSRDIENALFKTGDERALLTGLLYARIVSKFIGSYFVEMGGIDAIAFTAGVGENNPLIRRKVCEYFGYLGIEIDDVKNEKRGEDLVISTPQSNVKVMVIATDEELKIARETLANI